MKQLLTAIAMLVNLFVCFLGLVYLPPTGVSLFLICTLYVAGVMFAMYFIHDNKKLIL